MSYRERLKRVCFDLAIFWLKVNVFGHNASFSSLSLHMIKTKSVNWLTLRSFYRVLFDLETWLFSFLLHQSVTHSPFTSPDMKVLQYFLSLTHNKKYMIQYINRYNYIIHTWNTFLWKDSHCVLYYGFSPLFWWWWGVVNVNHHSQNRFHGPLMSCGQQFDKTVSSSREVTELTKHILFDFQNSEAT